MRGNMSLSKAAIREKYTCEVSYSEQNVLVGCHKYISMIPAYIDNELWVLKWPPAGDCFVNFTLLMCTADDQNCESQIILTPGNVTGM